MSALPQLILLPGMGADERLYAPQRRVFPDLWVPPWIPFRRGESAGEYAARFLEAMQPTPPYIIGGVSFGGMLALEIARLAPAERRPACVLSIGGICDRREVSLIMRAGARLRWVIRPATMRGVHAIAPIVNYFAGLHTKDQLTEFLDMFDEADAAFLRWAIGAILGWRGNCAVPVPVLRLHGASDRIVPRAGGADVRWVEGGGHLLPLSHPGAVNGFLWQVRRQFAEGASSA